MNYPLLERIPPDKRLTAINDLAKFQKKHHGNALDVVTDIKRNRYNPMESACEEIREISEDTEQDNIDELNREMSEPPHSPEKI